MQLCNCARTCLCVTINQRKSLVRVYKENARCVSCYFFYYLSRSGNETEAQTKSVRFFPFSACVCSFKTSRV